LGHFSILSGRMLHFAKKKRKTPLLALKAAKPFPGSWKEEGKEADRAFSIRVPWAGETVVTST